MVLCQISVFSQLGVKVCQTSIQTYIFEAGFFKSICPAQHLEVFGVFVLFCWDILALERTRSEVKDVVASPVFTITSHTQQSS